MCGLRPNSVSLTLAHQNAHFNRKPGIKYKTAAKRYRFAAVGSIDLQQGKGQGGQQPDGGDPLGAVGKNSVPGAVLILAHEGVGVAGDGTGQARGFAGLEQNDDDQGQRGKQHGNGADDS